MSDPTLSHIQRLQPELQTKAITFINALRNAGVPAIITSSTRTHAEQMRLVAGGFSFNPRSKHLTGQAFDYDVWGVDRDDIPTAWFDIVGPFGESLGLRWGGRWIRPYDPGHFELPV